MSNPPPEWRLVRSVLGDTAGALAEVEAALARYPLDQIPAVERSYYWLVRFFADAGEPDRARTLLEEYEREGRPGSKTILQLQGEIALAEGDYDAAVSYLERAVTLECPTCVLPGLARVYDRAGNADSAIATYERYRTTPYFLALERDYTDLAPALERLGQLYDERGDHANASRNYARFVELWREADPELQPRVRAAQARLEEILAEQG
ncbi:MAG: hypothetical protein P8Y21_15180 [Gemmatimonadales bacterium]